MRQFNHIGRLRPSRSVFDLSHEKKFNASMGLLYPILVEDCIPGDVFHIGNEVVCRFHQPLFAPLLHEVNVYVHYYFVPYRILWHDDNFYPAAKDKIPNPGEWERYLMGDEDGVDIVGTPNVFGTEAATDPLKAPGGVYDFLYGVAEFGPLSQTAALPNGDIQNDCLSAFPMLAYMRIWNEYYRDENLQEEITSLSGLGVNGILRRNWEKDYFTSALPSQQRGIMPALPGGSISARTLFDGAILANSPITGNMVFSQPGGPPRVIVETGLADSFRSWLNDNHVDVSGLFDISDLRMAVQLQKWLERNMRGGVRYTEFLKAHYADAPRDERLDRPEYIGGSKAPIIFSEVLQTSESNTTPQGHLAGHGLAADRSFCAKYRVHEHGVIIGLLSVMPRSGYSQGVDRFWKRRSKHEYYFPEFAHLSEQAIYEEELMLHQSSAGTNMEIFGYQGRYDEYRQRQSRAHGDLRIPSGDGGLDFWHLIRQFDKTVANRPVLSSDFVQCVPRTNIFPVPGEPGMLLNVGNILRVVRPLPVMGEPGLMDHF